MAADKFYLVDETHVTDKNKIAPRKDVLYFRHHTGVYDGHATRKQVQDFPTAFNEFKKENPKFKLPWAEDDVSNQDIASIDPKQDALGVVQHKAQNPEDEGIVAERSESVKVEEPKKSHKKAKKDEK